MTDSLNETPTLDDHRFAIVDDRILTSCAAVRARMDGWWTFAGGTTTTLNFCLSTRRDETNDAVEGC
jgi:hypothetical protein